MVGFTLESTDEERQSRLHELFDEHGAAVFRYAWKCTGRRDWAEELVNESFLGLHASLAQVDDSRLPGWLLTMVKNLAINRWRRKAQEQEFSEQLKVPSAETGGLCFGDLMVKAEGLNAIHRVCLTLRYVYGMERDQVSRYTGLSEEQVRKAIAVWPTPQPGAQPGDPPRFVDETGNDPIHWYQPNVHPLPELLVAVENDVLPVQLGLKVKLHLSCCRGCCHLLDDLKLAEPGTPLAAESARMRNRLPRLVPRKRVRRAPLLYVGVPAVIVLAGLLVSIRSDEPSGSTLYSALSTVLTTAKRSAVAPPAYRIPVIVPPLTVPEAARQGTGNLRGPEQAYVNLMRDALDIYREGKYREAALRLQAVASQYPRRVEAPFYAGVACLMAGETDQALEWLVKIPMADEHPLHDAQIWYHAAALERAGHMAEAVPLLKLLCGGNGAYRQPSCDTIRSVAGNQ